MDDQTLKYLQGKVNEGKLLQNQINGLQQFMIDLDKGDLADITIMRSGFCSSVCLSKVLGSGDTYKLISAPLTEVITNKIEELKAEFEGL